MNKATYDKINEYCSSQCKDVLAQAERDYVLRQFMDSYFQALQRYRDDHKTEPSSVDEQNILNSLLNDSTLHSYVISAQRSYEEYKARIEKDYARKTQPASFWGSVGTSLVANLCYSIILIIVFWVAKDQIATWLTQLAQP